MASKSENSEIAVLQTQMETVLSMMQDIKTLLTAQAANSVTRVEFTEKYKELEVKVKLVATLAENLKDTNERQQGAISLLRGFTAFLAACAAIMGALWWVKG
jgi:predicted ATP-dependent protease